ncbi:MAG: hypothetical protein ACJ8GO_11790 [Ramlibacter sp.]
MHRRLRFHPSPLTILVAIVLCLMASFAFGQVRKVGPGPTGNTGTTATTGLPAGSPSPSGLTSGAAPGLVRGTPSPSGLTSGSAPALPAGSPVGSGLTSGTAGGTAAVVVPGTTDTTATPTGGSTRGVVVIPVDPGAGAGGATVGTTGITGTTGTTGTPGTTGIAGTTGTTGGVAIVQGGFAGVTNGVPSVSPTRTQGGGPLTAVQVVQLFSQADADSDGLLTRAEALRLPLVTMSFDDMDTNRDGVVSRSEYDASLR